MDLSSIPLFQAIARRMSWLNERQSMLAQNVANADTPGYVPEDLKPLSFKQLIGGNSGHLTLAATEGGKMTGTQPPGDFATVSDPSADTTLSGNSVSLEGQMMKVAETTADYQLAVDLYRKQLGLLKIALGNSSGG